MPQVVLEQLKYPIAEHNSRPEVAAWSQLLGWEVGVDPFYVLQDHLDFSKVTIGKQMPARPVNQLQFTVLPCQTLGGAPAVVLKLILCVSHHTVYLNSEMEPEFKT